MPKVNISKISMAGKEKGKNSHEKFWNHQLFWNSLDPDKAVHAVHYSLY